MTMTGIRAAMPSLTDRLPLGSSGLEVSPFCHGMTMDPKVVPAVYEAGINFFFLTADMHWPLYDALRKGLQMLFAGTPSARDNVVIGVVAYVTQPEFCWAPFSEVVDELAGLQRIDLCIAGGAYGHEVDDRIKVFERNRGMAEQHVQQKAIGATFHDRKAARKVLDDNSLDIAYIRYNPIHPGAREDIFPHIKPRGPERKTLLFNFKSTLGHIADEGTYQQLGIGEDYWRPHITDYYRWAISAPQLDGILLSLPAPEAVQELVDAMAKGPLDEDDQQYLIDLADLSKGTAKLKP